MSCLFFSVGTLGNGQGGTRTWVLRITSPAHQKSGHAALYPIFHVVHSKIALKPSRETEKNIK